MDNKKFLEIVEQSFKKYLATSARSNEKLKVLHGAIATDLKALLGKDFNIQSLGFESGKETEIVGRYLPKKVDIVISKGKDALCGVAVKFVMSNYKQNSNNYFESMLGETANIRTANKGYFQVLVLPKKLPYFEKDGTISKIEIINEHDLAKYIKLSNDNTDLYFHTPNKTLIYIVDFLNFDHKTISHKTAFAAHFNNIEKLDIRADAVPYKFGDNIIVNDYETFIKKVVAYINYLS